MNQNISIASINDNSHYSVEYIADKLKYFSRPFPKKIIEAAIQLKNEMTSKLLEFLNYAYQNHESLDQDYMGHIYALFLLAEFKEAKAFDVALKLLELPKESLERLLGDCLTESYNNILTSLYNGNLASIKVVIENPNIDLFARDAAIRSLLGLIFESKLGPTEVLQYLETLLDNDIFKNSPEAMGFLICVIGDLCPTEITVQNKIKKLFENGFVDPSILNLEDFNSDLSHGYSKSTLGEQYGGIKSTINSMSWWHCFKEEYKVMARITTPNVKIGRNDPCPCGSGKKYKKCCLLNK